MRTITFNLDIIYYIETAIGVGKFLGEGALYYDTMVAI